MKTNLGAGGRQEVVDLLVDVDCPLQILNTANLGLDKMVAVNGGGDSGGVHAGRHELENGHLEGDMTSKTFT